MRSDKRGRLCKISYAVLAAAVILGLAAAAVYSQLVSHMQEICEYKGRQTANDIISDAIDEVLSQYGSGEDYLNICYDESGRITSITADTYIINELENDLKSAVNSSLSDIDTGVMSVPIGTLTGITYLSGRGFDVEVRLHQVGSVEAHIVSEFTSAGINQTKHSLRLEITAELSAILPGHSTDVTVSDEYIIGETVIVGEVPEGILTSFSQ